MRELIRTKWAAVGAAVAVSLGAGGISLTQAAISTGEMPVYVALSAPCRVVDTRPAAGPIGPKSTPISAGETNAYEIQITGANGNCTGGLAVPADAVAVALNVTAIAPSSPTGRSFFTVYPGDASLPNTSNVNFLSGQAPTPNKVDVGLSATGTIKIYNDAGTSHVAVDIFGYYIDHEHTGDDIVDGSLTGADVANNTLSSAKTSNEAGVASSFTTTPTSLTNSVQRVGSTAIRVPSDGFLHITASGIFSAGAAGTDMAWCQITKGPTRTSLNIFGASPEPWTSLSDFGASSAMTSGWSLQAVVPVNAADNPPLFITGQAIGVDCLELSGTVTTDDVVVTATFLPTSYKPVTLVISP